MKLLFFLCAVLLGEHALGCVENLDCTNCHDARGCLWSGTACADSTIDDDARPACDTFGAGGGGGGAAGACRADADCGDKGECGRDEVCECKAAFPGTFPNCGGAPPAACPPAGGCGANAECNRDETECECKAEFPGVWPNCGPPPAACPPAGGCGPNAECNRDQTECECLAGFTGAPPNCAAADPCAGINCGANGACNAGVCTCSNGFSGTRCEIAPDPCAGIDCGANGSCTAGACFCTGGFTGDRCQNAPADPCATVNCGPNGSCNAGACFCTGGFTGDRCQNAPDPCAGINCGGPTRGTCTAGRCVCIGGFTGDRCQNAPDPCAGVNCGANGRCVAGACQCNQGFQGDRCQTAMPCTAAMAGCLNGGAAGGVTGACTCRCAEAFFGAKCENARASCDKASGPGSAAFTNCDAGFVPRAGATSFCDGAVCETANDKARCCSAKCAETCSCPNQESCTSSPKCFWTGTACKATAKCSAAICPAGQIVREGDINCRGATCDAEDSFTCCKEGCTQAECQQGASFFPSFCAPSGYCVKQAALGAACDAIINPCAFGSHCHAGVCDIDAVDEYGCGPTTRYSFKSKTCVPRGAAGDYCNYAQPCLPTLACGKNVPHVCN